MKTQMRKERLTKKKVPGSLWKNHKAFAENLIKDKSYIKAIEEYEKVVHSCDSIVTKVNQLSKKLTKKIISKSPRSSQNISVKKINDLKEKQIKLFFKKNEMEMNICNKYKIQYPIPIKRLKAAIDNVTDDGEDYCCLDGHKPIVEIMHLNLIRNTISGKLNPLKEMLDNKELTELKGIKLQKVISTINEVYDSLNTEFPDDSDDFLCFRIKITEPLTHLHYYLDQKINVSDAINKLKGLKKSHKSYPKLNYVEIGQRVEAGETPKEIIYEIYEKENPDGETDSITIEDIERTIKAIERKVYRALEKYNNRKI